MWHSNSTTCNSKLYALCPGLPDINKMTNIIEILTLSQSRKLIEVVKLQVVRQVILDLERAF